MADRYLLDAVYLIGIVWLVCVWFIVRGFVGQWKRRNHDD